MTCPATEASYDCFQSLSWPDTLPDNVLEHHDGRVEARARFSGRSLGTTRLGLHRDGQMEYLREILRARVYDVAVETPLQHAPLLSKRLGNDVFLKREDMQPVKSFKIRGAYNKMVNLSPSARDRGVICASAGNHAQGVALSANKLRLKAIIVMPKTTAPVKLEAVKSFGAEHVEIVLHGETFAEALSHAKQLEHDCGLTFVHPYDDPSVIVGQGTIGMEILRQFSKPLHAVFIAVGGGGMIAGIAAYIKQVRPEIRIIGVQTVDSNSMALSLQAGTPTAIEDVGMFADGTSIRMVGAETLRLAKLYVDEIVEVTTDQVCAALKDVFLDTRTVLEPSGAMSIAGAKLYCHNNPQLSGTNLVCVACGANINFDRLKFIVERAELGQERLLLLAVRLRQRPLMDLLRTTRNGIRDLSYDGDRLLLGLSVDDFDQADKVKESLASFKFVDLTTNEYGKVHQRYMTGRIQAETVVRFEFQERIGAVLRLLERIADGSFRISAVHYSCSGGDVARVLIGVANSRSSFVAFCEKLGKPYRRFFDETNNPAYQLFCE